MRSLKPFDLDAYFDQSDAFSSKEFRVMARKGAESVELEIMGDIGDDAGPGGVSASAVRGLLRENQDAPVNVVVNSPGGLVFDGLAIYNAFLEHPQPVTATVMGLAYSAASVAILGADRVVMYENAQIGIHRAWALAMGNAEQMRATAEILESIDGSLIGIYSARTGASSTQVARWMKGTSDGTMFSAAESIKNGFADEMIENRRSADAAAAARKQNTPRLSALMAQRKIARARRGDLTGAAK